MNILVVGGTGMVGGNAALFLKQAGHSVTIMSRNRPTAEALSALDFIETNYIEDGAVTVVRALTA